MKRRTLLLLVLLLVSGLSIADSEQLLDLEHYWLDNGLEVILVRDTIGADRRGGHLVSGRQRQRSRRQEVDFAHLFEHMMFEGSPHIPDIHGMDALA